MENLLVADIGGTKNEWAIYGESAGEYRKLCQKRYCNAQFSGCLAHDGRRA